MTNIISLTPNFSWVSGMAVGQNRFNGLPTDEKPLKRLNRFARSRTRLKPGANDIEAAVANHK